MLSQFKRLGGDSLLYALMSVGTKIIAFVMFPIYTRFLPNPAEYGVLDYVDRLTSLLTFLIIFGTDSALAFYYYDTKDEEKRLKYIQQVMLFRLGIVVLLFLTVLVGGEWLAELLLESPDTVNLLYISAGTLLLDTIITVVLMVLRFQFKTIKVVIYTVLKMFLIAAFSYILLATFMTSVEGILLGRIISGIVVILLISPYLPKFMRFKVDKAILVELLKYAAPLVPASLAFWIIMNSNVFFLKEFTSLTEVGIYGTAMKFATVITLLTSGVQMAWRPYSMSIKDNPDSRFIFSKLFMIILLIGTFGILFIATLMPWVIKLLNPNYWDAYKYVAPISAVTFLNFYYLIISVGLFFKKETKPISIIFGIAAALNVVLCIILIPLFSIWGTVFAYLLPYMFAVVSIFIKSQKVYYVPVSLYKIGFIFCNMLLTVFGIIFVQEQQMSWVYILLIWIYFIASTGLSRVDKDIRGKKVQFSE